MTEKAGYKTLLNKIYFSLEDSVQEGLLQVIVKYVMNCNQI